MFFPIDAHGYTVGLVACVVLLCRVFFRHRCMRPTWRNQRDYSTNLNAVHTELAWKTSRSRGCIVTLRGPGSDVAMRVCEPDGAILRFERGYEMHEELWAGVDLKVRHAEFFLEQMARSLQPPEQTATYIAIQSTGTMIDTHWQRSFYASLDAFLAMARSVPEIIQSCFGADRGSKVMRDWFDALGGPEQTRRHGFSGQFAASRRTFGVHSLSTARNISLHRKGYPPVEITITGRYGVTYVGDPVNPIPVAENRQEDAGNDPALQWAATQPPTPLQLSWQDFKIDGRPLFVECQTYLKAAQDIVAQARNISKSVHSGDTLTLPPS